MDHPPIPPNCPRFSVIGNPCIHIGGDHFVDDRQLVACFMRCAWLDEWRRLRGMNVGLFTSEESLQIHLEELERTQKNAELWREYGEQ